MSASQPTEQEIMHRLYLDVFGSEKGRRVLKDLIRRARVLTPTYVEQDVNTTIWFDGQRALVLGIIKTLGIAEDDERFLQSAISKDPFVVLKDMENTNAD